MGAVLWAEASDGDADETAETEAHGQVDETLASRRLGRWLRGMFGGNAAEEPAEERDD